MFERDLPNYEYELLYIDNCSSDRTRELLKELGKQDKHVKAILNAKNFGQFNSDRKSTRLNSSHSRASRMPSSA